MNKPQTTSPQPGLCSFKKLPEQYQLAFQEGLAHQLSGQFLPAEIDWFQQIFLMPFWLVYALPPMTLPIALLNPKSYARFLQIVRQQNAIENLFLLGLLALTGVLLVYCGWFAWSGCSSFVRTWQATQFQKHDRHGFGLALLAEGLVARLIDNIDTCNCIWLPREAIIDILWHEIREEGTKHSRWVYRTHICYVVKHRGKLQKRWLVLRDHMFHTGHPTGAGSIGDSRGDRFIFEQLHNWWNKSIN